MTTHVHAKRAIFLDKDGTLVDDVPFNVDPAQIRLAAEAGPALRLLRQKGYALIVVTNQSGIAKGLFPESALEQVRQRLSLLLAEEGVTLDGFYYCPHHPQAVVPQYALSCTCRKPMPGLLQQAAHEHGIHLEKSWMIGDILDDVESGRRAGCRTVLINNGNETEWVASEKRTPDLVVPDLHVAALTIAMNDDSLPDMDFPAVLT